MATAKETRGSKLKGQVTCACSSKVTRDQLHQVLDRVLREHGCIVCGLVGLDLRFVQGDPLRNLSGLDGVAGVTFAKR